MAVFVFLKVRRNCFIFCPEEGGNNLFYNVERFFQHYMVPCKPQKSSENPKIKLSDDSLFLLEN
jgi:hypothetical protein